jgi:hypothetical protein
MAHSRNDTPVGDASYSAPMTLTVSLTASRRAGGPARAWVVASVCQVVPRRHARAGSAEGHKGAAPSVFRLADTCYPYCQPRRPVVHATISMASTSFTCLIIRFAIYIGNWYVVERVFGGRGQFIPYAYLNECRWLWCQLAPTTDATQLIPSMIVGEWACTCLRRPLAKPPHSWQVLRRTLP